VHLLALLLWHLVTLLVWLFCALFLLDRAAVLTWHIGALLLCHITTVIVRLLHLPLLLHIFAGVVWVGLAGGAVRYPPLVIASSLPVVLTVFLVISCAVGLCVSLHLVSVLCLAYSVCHRSAFTLSDCFAHLARNILALVAIKCATLGHINCFAFILCAFAILS